MKEWMFMFVGKPYIIYTLIYSINLSSTNIFIHIPRGLEAIYKKRTRLKKYISLYKYLSTSLKTQPIK